MRPMNPSSNPLSRVLALVALLVLVLNTSAAAMAMEPGFWQRFLPVCVVGAGIYLAIQSISLTAAGTTAHRAAMFWRFVGSFAFFVGAFHLLVVLMPRSMWDQTKQAVAEAREAGTEIAAMMTPGVDERLRHAVDLSGPFSPGMMLVLNLLLLAVAFFGVLVEDANRELEPVV